MPSFASLWKKNLFSTKNNAILHNRVILYFIFLVSLGNLFYLTVERDITSIVIFLLVGFLTSFFSKNMLIILFVALITSAVLKHGAKIRHEGLENMVDEPDDSGSAEVPPEEVSTEEQEDNDLSNEFYMEKDENGVPRKKKIENYEGEDDEDDEDEEELVENYEGESDSKDSSGKDSSGKDSSDKEPTTTKTADTKKTKTSDESILSACVRKCLGN